MRVTTWIEKEVEVEVSVEEAMAELCAMPIPNNKENLMFVINRCVGVLRHCTDEAVALLGQDARKIVSDALRQQAARYDPPIAPRSTSA